MTQQTKPKNNGYQQPDNPAPGETLDPETVAKIWAKRALELAKEPPAPETGKTVDVLVFLLANERYGINVTNVREIHQLRQLTPVPRTPNFVAGVFSARGRILSAIDLRAFFGLSPISVSDETKIIVVANTNSLADSDKMEVGILANEVQDVITIFEDDIAPPLSTHTGAKAEHLLGIADNLLAILSLNTLLADNRLLVNEG